MSLIVGFRLTGSLGRTHRKPNCINQNVPADILFQIFGHLNEQDASPASDNHIPLISRKLRPGAHYSQLIRAASVCRYWRDIIHTTSSLWAHVFIVDSDGDALLDFLQWQISLTRQQRLHITNEIYGSQMFSPGIMNLLLRCSHRWASFDLTAPLPIMERLFTTKSMPQLKCLQLRITRDLLADSEHRSPTSMPPKPTVDAPQLTHATLYNADGQRLSLPWDQLETFSFDTSSAFELVPLLHDVEKLTVYWEEGDFVEAWKQPGIDLPYLRHVDLVCYDPCTFSETFQTDLGYLPLQRGGTIGFLFRGTTMAEDLLRLQQPLIPFTLTALHIRHYLSPSDGMLVAALRNLPRLQSFRMDDGDDKVMNALLDELCCDAEFLPNLEELGLPWADFKFQKGRGIVDARILVEVSNAPISQDRHFRVVRDMQSCASRRNGFGSR